MIESKKRYKEYKLNKGNLPKDYQEAITALEKYMFNFAKGENFMVVLEDVLGIFQEAALDNLNILEVVGENPVIFADTIMAEYPEELWIVKYQNKLKDSFNTII